MQALRAALGMLHPTIDVEDQEDDKIGMGVTVGAEEQQMLTLNPTKTSRRAGMLHPTINVEDPEDKIDMGVIVGAQKQHVFEPLP